jgi:hypothetical protein
MSSSSTSSSSSGLPKAYILVTEDNDDLAIALQNIPVALSGVFDCTFQRVTEAPNRPGVDFAFTLVEHKQLQNAHDYWKGHCIVRLFYKNSGGGGSEPSEGIKGSRSRTLVYATNSDAIPVRGGSTLEAVIRFTEDQQTATELCRELRGMRQTIADHRADFSTTDSILKLALKEDVTRKAKSAVVFVQTHGVTSLPIGWENGTDMRLASNNKEYADLHVLVLEGAPSDMRAMLEDAGKAQEDWIVLVYAEGHWDDNQIALLINKVAARGNPLHVVGHDKHKAAHLIELAVQRGRTRRSRIHGKPSVTEHLQAVDALSKKLEIDAANM